MLDKQNTAIMIFLLDYNNVTFFNKDDKIVNSAAIIK